MEAFEIVRLVGESIALILGAIVFLVFFFRSMSWIDCWIKRQNETNLNRPSKRRHDGPRRPRSSDLESRIRQRQSTNAVMRTALIGKEPISHLGNPSSEPVAVANAESEPAAKSVNRIVTVHLLSGETIDRVAICSKDKANTICEELGFEGVAFEHDDGQICVVGENNIKMVTWKPG